MSFATLTNIITMIFCSAVLVQSVRMMQSLKAVKSNALPQVVEALDKSTAQARLVLSELKETLRTDGAAATRTVKEGAAICDELTVMIGIGNSVAERILEAASAGNRAVDAAAEAEAKAEDQPIAAAA